VESGGNSTHIFRSSSSVALGGVDSKEQPGGRDERRWSDGPDGCGAVSLGVVGIIGSTMVISESACGFAPEDGGMVQMLVSGPMYVYVGC